MCERDVVRKMLAAASRDAKHVAKAFMITTFVESPRLCQSSYVMTYINGKVAYWTVFWQDVSNGVGKTALALVDAAQELVLRQEKSKPYLVKAGGQLHQLRVIGVGTRQFVRAMR